MDLEKLQFSFVLSGAAITFLLLITFNLVLPVVFQNVLYIPLAAIFFFPFIAFYHVRHHEISSFERKSYFCRDIRIFTYHFDVLGNYFFHKPYCRYYSE